jgi:phosphate transport system substrate-binding protein
MLKTIALGVLFALAAGCKGGESTAEPGGVVKPGASGAAPTSDGSLTLTGAGATFPFPLYSKWAAEYGKAKPNVKINYQSIGSGGGIRQITERTVDYGASDAPMTDEQLAAAKGVIHIPTCLGSVAIAYNLEGVANGLKLTPEILTNIFLGKVKDWSDPAIAKENPDVKLPKKAIASVHRSDGSGTTKIFVDYLSAVSTEWKASPGTGTSVNWPGGLGAKGNEGVAGQVKSTPGAIGYVELAYALQNGMSVASLKNAAGKYVTPSLDSTTAAAAGVTMPEDLRVSIVNAPGETAYPISGFTYLLVYQEQKDAAKGKALVDFLAWAAHDGQKLTKDLNYAALPAEIVAKVDAKIASIKGPDGKALGAK